MTSETVNTKENPSQGISEWVLTWGSSQSRRGRVGGSIAGCCCPLCAPLQQISHQEHLNLGSVSIEYCVSPCHLLCFSLGKLFSSILLQLQTPLRLFPAGEHAGAAHAHTGPMASSPALESATVGSSPTSWYSLDAHHTLL